MYRRETIEQLKARREEDAKRLKELDKRIAYEQGDTPETPPRFPGLVARARRWLREHLGKRGSRKRKEPSRVLSISDLLDSALREATPKIPMIQIPEDYRLRDVPKAFGTTTGAEGIELESEDVFENGDRKIKYTFHTPQFSVEQIAAAGEEPSVVDSLVDSALKEISGQNEIELNRIPIPRPGKAEE